MSDSLELPKPENPEKATKTEPNRLGVPISDDSSGDEESQIRALDEEQGIRHSYHEEVVVSPKYESDDDIPLQRFQLSHPTVHSQPTATPKETVEEKRRESIPVEERSASPALTAASNTIAPSVTTGTQPKSVPSDSESSLQNFQNSGAGMERRRSVRFSGAYDGEDEDHQRYASPSPESLRYIKALENPMQANSDLEHEFQDLDPPAPPQYPRGDPPAYSSGDEGSKTPPPPPGGSNRRQGSINDLFINKVSQPFHNMIRRASRLEEDTTPSEEEEEDDDDDYTEDEIAVLTYIDNYKAKELEATLEFHPFVVEYMAAFGEIDPFIKVPRPDEIDDNVGLMAIDEPPCEQSDATIVDMQIRHATKDAAILDDEVPVKILEKADEKPDEITKWIEDIKALHKSRPPISVHHKTPLPDIERLMQEWAPKLEDIMKTAKLPTADLDVPLEQFADICLNILDIPVGKSRIESLQTMFSLLNEFNNSQHFRNMAQNNIHSADDRERMDRLEL